MKEIEMGKWVLNVMINLKLKEKRSVLITTKWSYKIKQFQKKKKNLKKGEILTSSLLRNQVKSLKTHSKIDIMYVMEELRLRKNKCAKMVGLIYKRGKVKLWRSPHCPRTQKLVSGLIILVDIILEIRRKKSRLNCRVLTN